MAAALYSGGASCCVRYNCTSNSLRRYPFLLKGGTMVRSVEESAPREFRKGFDCRSTNTSARRFPLSKSTLMENAVPPKQEVFTVGDFMTRRENLFVVKPTTTVDEALESLVENRITGLPVVDDNWRLIGVVSDYDLLALDSISGAARTGTGLFPEVDRTWKTFNEIRKLLSKTNGKIVAEVMTPSPIVVRETTNLEDAARLLLETKYRRLPVVDSGGKLVGILTRGNVVKAALQMKRAAEKTAAES